MQVVYERCCGLDIHKAKVVACVITPEGKELHTFGTMTSDLLALADWLTSKGITHVAMESTGVFWKPVYNLLEGYDFKLLVVNAQHIKAVPGRKTDVKDAEWIADLLRHGLLRGSRIPERSQRELQELVRYRKSLIRERASEVNRVHKVLEGANVKLSSVLSDVMGKSGKAMLKAMASGVNDPGFLSSLALGSLKEKRPQIEEAVRGVMGEHQRMMLSLQLRHIEFLDQQIEELNREISRRMLPFEEALSRIDAIPGIARTTAEAVIAEIGVDMSWWPTHKHISSWAGLCPGNDESAGKRKSGRTRKGNPWLKEALVEAAQAASHAKDSYLSAHYHRLARRIGKKKAVVAVAHTILVIIYHMLKDGTGYKDLGANYFDEREKEAVVRRAVRRIESLGYMVFLQPVEAA